MQQIKFQELALFFLYSRSLNFLIGVFKMWYNKKEYIFIFVKLLFHLFIYLFQVWGLLL
jgi:hypothetical protein